ncbi:MAG: carbon-nitrogen hydrolase family protein [Psychromonas sp.]|nr:carbon-nitrogen hydrolase family protein [Psychromonas sp.]
MNNNLSAIQMLSVSEADINLAHLKQLLAQLAPKENQLVLLPEDALSFADKESYLLLAEELGKGYYQEQLAALAKQYRCCLVCGSFPIKSRQENKIFTTTLVFSAQGELISHYHKLHLFDALVSDKKGCYKESDIFMPGQDSVLFDWVVDSSTTVKVGLAICYDLRFPALFQMLRAQGAEIILVPAAFTKVTGEAHWQPLLQARAIENQCYIVASNQGGLHANGRETFGHSMIISPWGEVISQLQFGEGVIEAEFKKSLVAEVRQTMPVILHNRFIHSLDK